MSQLHSWLRAPALRDADRAETEETGDADGDATRAAVACGSGDDRNEDADERAKREALEMAEYREAMRAAVAKTAEAEEEKAKREALEMADYRDAMRAAVEASRVAEAAMAKHRESMRAAQAVRVAIGGHRAEPADAEGAGEGEAASPRGRPDAGHLTSLAQYFELGNDGSSSEEEEDEEVQKEEKPQPAPVRNISFEAGMPEDIDEMYDFSRLAEQTHELALPQASSNESNSPRDVDDNNDFSLLRPGAEDTDGPDEDKDEDEEEEQEDHDEHEEHEIREGGHVQVRRGEQQQEVKESNSMRRDDVRTDVGHAPTPQRRRVAFADERLEDARERSRELEERLRRAEQRAEERDQELEAAARALAEVEVALEARGADCAELQGLLAEKEEQLRVLLMEKEEQKAHTAKLQAEVERLRIHLEEGEEALPTAAAEQIVELAQVAEELTEALEQAKAEERDAKEKLVQMQARLAAQDQEGKRDRVSSGNIATEAALASQTKQTERLQAHVDKLEALISEQEARLMEALDDAEAARGQQLALLELADQAESANEIWQPVQQLQGLLAEKQLQLQEAQSDAEAAREELAAPTEQILLITQVADELVDALELARASEQEARDQLHDAQAHFDGQAKECEGVRQKLAIETCKAETLADALHAERARAHELEERIALAEADLSAQLKLASKGKSLVGRSIMV